MAPPLPPCLLPAQVELIVASNNPGLAGPAFPPAWLAEGAMRGLEELRLSFNEGLTGSLPPSLPWPRLYSL